MLRSCPSIPPPAASIAAALEHSAAVICDTVARPVQADLVHAVAPEAERGSVRSLLGDSSASCADTVKTAVQAASDLLSVKLRLECVSLEPQLGIDPLGHSLQEAALHPLQREAAGLESPLPLQFKRYM